MWTFLFIIFLLVSIFSSVITFYALRRINNYERLIINISDLVQFIDLKVKALDNKGSFESDDEVGFFFEEVKNLQKLLNEIFETQEGDNNETK
jgi:hypothetical protein